jgi:drug/metabolite transporter (DMT)-like permease
LTLAGVVIAVIGLALLTGGGGGGFGRGELLTLLCALCFAAHIVVLGEVANRHDPVRITAVQAITVGVGCGLPGFALGGYGFPTEAVTAAAFTGVFATAVSFLLMVDAQRVVAPARAALVLLLEPVFAGILGYVDGESLGAAGLAGAALILVAVVVAEVLPDWNRLTRAPTSENNGHY